MANGVSKTILAAKSVELKFQLRKKGPLPLLTVLPPAHCRTACFRRPTAVRPKADKDENQKRYVVLAASTPGLEIRASHATANGSAQTYTLAATKLKLTKTG